LRLSLSGLSDTGALLSALARDFSLDVNLVQARVEDIQGVAVGTLFVTVQGQDSDLNRAIESLAQRQIVTQEIANDTADN